MLYEQKVSHREKSGSLALGGKKGQHTILQTRETQQDSQLQVGGAERDSCDTGEHVAVAFIEELIAGNQEQVSVMTQLSTCLTP